MTRLKILFLGAAMAAAASASSADPDRRYAKLKKGYYAPYATGADGQRHPIMQIPGSDTVLSREILDDQNARSLRDALRGVAGVTATGH